MFFIQSSDREHLLPRMACSVESALRASQVPLIIVVLTATHLDLTQNATCHLYHTYPEDRLRFHHAVQDELFADSPLQPLYEEGQFDATHSDVLIYKHGGWYSDLDVVFMKDIRGLSNIITGDHHPRAEDYASIGGALNNAIFHFDRKHPFVQACLEDFASNFNPEVSGTFVMGSLRL
eukprot:maker-scaffold191_size271209-snap-gene-1.30 protein:Tk06182 transcript:maker-scaffold191_size271209-snap-gene-1.30-mRNA-1 annotation:"lactosylceramide 4-alpha-"